MHLLNINVEFYERYLLSIKYMIIGSIPTDSISSYGGATVLVKQLIDYYDEKKIEYIYIQTNKYTGKLANLINYVYSVYCFFKYIKSVDIVFTNVASNGIYYLSPLLLYLSKKYKKKFICRNFGGNSIELYEDVIGIKRIFIRYLYEKSNIIFFETKYLVKYFRKINPNTFWFPNSRKSPEFIRDQNKVFEKRFVFLGHIKEEKGIDDLLEASEKLDSSYNITLYGNIKGDKYNDELWEKYENIRYGGQLKHSEVYKTLSQFDVMILPSHREGYPGSIVEAFGIGLPVISTKLPSIKEMVDKKCGILVNIKNSVELASAIMSIDQDNFRFFSKNSLFKFEDYKYENVYKNIIEICEGRN